MRFSSNRLDFYYLFHKFCNNKGDKMSKTPYTTDGEYTLYLLVDIFDSGNKTYSIYDSNNDHCGAIELKNPMSDTPEIGVELLENKRNQGIAKKAVKMLVQKVCQERDVEYFLIKISSQNHHSKHVFEKMGAIFIGEEDNIYKRLISQFGDKRENLSADEQKILEDCLNDDNIKVINRYKLMPDVFE